MFVYTIHLITVHFHRSFHAYSPSLPTGHKVPVVKQAPIHTVSKLQRLSKRR